MSAVAVRERHIRTEGRVVDRRAVKAGRAARRASRFRRLAGRLFIVAALAASFFYIAVYAGLTAVSYNKSRLTQTWRLEKIRNERLTVELVRRSSPHYITAAAQHAGMVCATQYDYLHKPAAVARADE